MTAPPDLPSFLLAHTVNCEADAPDIHAAGCFSSWWEHDRPGYSASECNCGVPARIVAECAAKRRIVEAFIRLDRNRERLTDAALHLQWNKVVGLLAQPYADDPGFDPSWRP